MGSVTSTYASDLTSSVYSVFVPRYDDAIDSNNLFNETIVKIAEVGSKEIHTLSLSKSESENSIIIKCDDSIVNSLPDLFDKWVLVEDNETEEGEEDSPKNSPSNSDNDEEDILSDINITPKVPEPVYYDKEEFDESDWVFVEEKKDVSTSSEVIMLKEQISTLTIRLEQMNQSFFLAMSQMNFSNSNFNSSQFHLVNQTLNNINNINDNNKTEEEKKDINNNINDIKDNNNNENTPAVISPPTNLPPPPPPPSQMDISQASRTLRIQKAQPQVRTIDNIKKSLGDAIELSDISPENKIIASNNYMKCFPSENALKYLDFMITNYAQLITALPLKPKTSFELVKLWEDNLFSKIENQVERCAIRRRKMTEICLKRDKQEVLEEIAKVFKFIEANKKEEKEKAKKNELKKNFMGDLIKVLQDRNKGDEDKNKEELKEMEVFDADNEFTAGAVCE